MKVLKRKKLAIWLSSIVLAITLIAGGFTMYVSDYYRADTQAIKAFSVDGTVEQREIKKGVTAYGKEDAKYGIIFYPGGKVEYTAYEPLMRQLASKGALCILVKMPFNLAVLDINAADGICEKYPNVTTWYMAGHSLGGSMAASYIAKNTEEFKGLILLAAYSTSDISESGLRVLSIYGSEDTVMNKEKYDECKKNLPAAAIEVKLKGGCHAYFGMYGEQAGDGTPTITNTEQIKKASDHITQFITEGEK